VLSFIKKK